MTFLIVDDNPGVRRVLRRVVKAFATEIWESNDGADAFNQYRLRRPTFVLMDVNMSQMDGLTATKAICDFDPSARVIIVTDLDDAETRTAACAAGALEVLSKDDLTSLEDLLGDADAKLRRQNKTP
jgi:DNA-binding NarL/FixJ family response regulator